MFVCFVSTYMFFLKYKLHNFWITLVIETMNWHLICLLLWLYVSILLCTHNTHTNGHTYTYLYLYVHLYLCSSVMSDSFWSHGLWSTSFLCPWDFAGRNTGVEYMSFSRESSKLRDWTHISCISCIAGGLFTTEPPGKSICKNIYIYIMHICWTIWNEEQEPLVARCAHVTKC